MMNHMVDKLIDAGLQEDIGTGDITTEFLIEHHLKGKASIIAKEPIVLAGLSVAESVFRRLDKTMDFVEFFQDGECVPAGGVILSMTGYLKALLIGERVALNFLQRLSGIATLVRSYVEETRGLPLKLVDTRKTTPGYRYLEKYATRMGGAVNHRMGLFDGILIKDNHIAACGSIKKAVEKVRESVSHFIKIEVETATIEQVREAIDAHVDIIMLDNMNDEEIKNAVAFIQKRAIIEVSGNVDKNRLKRLTGLGVDIVSVGALTHSARAVDLSMRIVGER